MRRPYLEASLALWMYCSCVLASFFLAKKRFFSLTTTFLLQSFNLPPNRSRFNCVSRWRAFGESTPQQQLARRSSSLLALYSKPHYWWVLMSAESCKILFVSIFRRRRKNYLFLERRIPSQKTPGCQCILSRTAALMWRDHPLYSAAPTPWP